VPFLFLVYWGVAEVSIEIGRFILISPVKYFLLMPIFQRHTGQLTQDALLEAHRV